MNNSIRSYTYLPLEASIMLTYEDGTTETFSEADATRYVELTGRPDDAVGMGWAYTPTATEDTDA
jgi:hypothetical protein